MPGPTTSNHLFNQPTNVALRCLAVLGSQTMVPQVRQSPSPPSEAQGPSMSSILELQSSLSQGCPLPSCTILQGASSCRKGSRAWEGGTWRWGTVPRRACLEHQPSHPSVSPASPIPKCGREPKAQRRLVRVGLDNRASGWPGTMG